MTQADSVHSTPPTNTSAFRDLESTVCDLARLAELSMLTAIHYAQDPKDEKALSHAVLLSEILHEKVQALKAAFYAACEE